MASEAERQLETFIDRYDPRIAALGRKAIAWMKRRLPGATVMVYDNYNALAVGFAPDDKVRGIPLSIALYPRWVTLFFMFGARLPDPDGLLTGSGAVVRSIRLDGMETLKDERVAQLITEAVLDRGWTLDPKKKSELLVKSISAKQRPRRP